MINLIREGLITQIDNLQVNGLQVEHAILFLMATNDNENCASNILGFSWCFCLKLGIIFMQASFFVNLYGKSFSNEMHRICNIWTISQARKIHWRSFGQFARKQFSVKCKFSSKPKILGFYSCYNMNKILRSLVYKKTLRPERIL